jgi:thiol-disulfide isomerase/thioredoxin
MFFRLLAVAFLAVSAAFGSIVGDVRAAIARNDFTSGERLIAEYRATNGVTPEMVEAHSWMGRGALAAKQYDKAEVYAVETRKLSLEQLKKRPLDAERHLPIALGASIEVQAQVMAARGARSEAVAFLRRELEIYRNTSIRTRIQKNINLLSLEGRPAPPLEMKEYLGPKPVPLASLKGKVLVLFFWAHWCGQCKAQAPILARLESEFGDKGLLVIGPTQRYGYATRGEDATPAEELRHIEQVRRQYYSALSDMPVPVSDDNFKTYGCSTTPTLLLVDRQGIVRMYHPGRMPYEELAARIAALAGN